MLPSRPDCSVKNVGDNMLTNPEKSPECVILKHNRRLYRNMCMRRQRRACTLGSPALPVEGPGAATPQQRRARRVSRSWSLDTSSSENKVRTRESHDSRAGHVPTMLQHEPRCVHWTAGTTRDRGTLQETGGRAYRTHCTTLQLSICLKLFQNKNLKKR